MSLIHVCGLEDLYEDDLIMKIKTCIKFRLHYIKL